MVLSPLTHIINTNTLNLKHLMNILSAFNLKIDFYIPYIWIQSVLSCNIALFIKITLSFKSQRINSVQKLLEPDLEHVKVYFQVKYK